MVINAIAMNHKQIIIPTQLQQNVLERLHSNNVGIKQPKDKIIPQEVPGKQWDVVGTDLCSINKRKLFLLQTTTVSNSNRRLSAESLGKCYKSIFVEFGLPRGIMSDKGTTFIFGKSTDLCRKFDIEIAIL